MNHHFDQAAHAALMEAAHESIDAIIAGIGRLTGVIRVEGQPELVVGPVGDYQVGLDFDLAMTGAGAHRYIRERAEGDFLEDDPEIPEAYRHTRVVEFLPGVLVRAPILVIFDHERN